MSTIAAGMHDPFGNALVVEVEDFLAKMEVIDKSRASCSEAKHVLVVGNGAALGGRQHRLSVFSELMKLATFASMKPLVVNSCDVGGCCLRRPFGHCLVPWDWMR
jgi:hypothetical protein